MTSKKKILDISKIPQIRIRLGSVNFLQKIGKKRAIILAVGKIFSR